MSPAGAIPPQRGTGGAVWDVIMCVVIIVAQWVLTMIGSVATETIAQKGYFASGCASAADCSRTVSDLGVRLVSGSALVLGIGVIVLLAMGLKRGRWAAPSVFGVFVLQMVLLFLGYWMAENGFSIPG